MAKVSRADWANGVDWRNVANKPDTPGTASDIGQLTGLGYGNGQYPRFNAALGRFRPATLPSPSPTPTPSPTPASIIVSWDCPSLMPLQSAWEDFDYVGVIVSQPITLGTPFADDFVLAVATVPAPNVVRITVTNMGFDTVDLGEGSWTIRL